MKVRDSGMPTEDLWSTFFDVESILNKMQIDRSVNNLLEVGCGYGTFTMSAAKRISGRLSAIDIEQEMINYTNNKSIKEDLTNIDLVKRDIIAEGSGLPDELVSYVMLFNILHHAEPL